MENKDKIALRALAVVSILWSIGWFVAMPIKASFDAKAPHSIGGGIIVSGEASFAAWDWFPFLIFVGIGILVFAMCAAALRRGKYDPEVEEAEN